MDARRLLTFVETATFQHAWAALGLNLDDLFALQQELLTNPFSGPVVRGAGGLRKCRFAPKRSGRGQSGAYRVGYAVFPAIGRIALLFVYPKSAKADLTPSDRANAKRVLEILARKWENP